MKIIKQFTVTLVAAASVLAATTVKAQTEVRVDPSPILTYVGPTSMFSTHGTNDALGFTNSLKTVSIKGGKDVAFELSFAGYNAGATNSVTLVIYPLLTLGGTNVLPSQVSRIGYAGSGTTAVKFATNSTWNAYPYLAVQVESPVASGTCALTNLYLRMFVK